MKSWEADEVYLVFRAPTHRAFPWTYVFPGGRIDPSDREVEVLDPEGACPHDYVAAARELFEEVGVLPAVRRCGGPVDPGELPALRRALLAGELSFSRVMSALGAVVDGRTLLPLGVKTTPRFFDVRFRNRFFLAVLPEGQEPAVVPGELESGLWIRADEAVRRFEAGDLPLVPPVLGLLEILAGHRPDQSLERLRQYDDEKLRDLPLIARFSPEVYIFPASARTLPPAWSTNTYVVGRDRLLVVDPATSDQHEGDQLLALISSLSARGGSLEAIVLTHHHPDHLGALHRVLERFPAPVWAHRLTAERLADVEVSRFLEDGETIDLGDGGAVRVIHTPGHAPGHVCLLQQKFGGLIVGDMVSTTSTIIIDPPEGDLVQYLASLAKLMALDARVLYPGHGIPTRTVRQTLQWYLDHRARREQQVLDGLDRTWKALDALVPEVYSDEPVSSHRYAARNLLATLLKLQQDGRAERDEGGRWRRR
ncbi:MAG: MBL fold metallo-hydrolase [Candidatus Riflebacteria bacterium]|nr:MBL fold metallo-hydrolase [Candidatus Riflebacteria bacterium]